MSRRIGTEVLVFALFTLVVVAMTWPLVRNLPTALSDLGDPLLNTWILDWDLHALTSQPLQLFDAPIFTPSLYPLAFSENLVGVALLVWPFKLLGLGPIGLYNIAMILGFALSGYGASVLARTAGASLFASVVSGGLYTFCQYRFDHLAHLQIISACWLPLALAALFRYWRAPSSRIAVLAGGSFAMAAATSIHWFIFGGFAIACTLLLFAVAAPGRDWKFWVRLAAAFVVAGVILLPILLPYHAVSKKYGMERVIDEVASGSAVWSDWLGSSTRNVLWGRIPHPFRPERALFPGGMALFLTAAAFLLASSGRKQESIVGWVPPHALLHVLDALAVAFGFAVMVGGATESQVRVRAGTLVLFSVDNAVTPAVLLLLVVLLRFSIRLPDALGGSSGRRLGDVIAGSRFTIEEIGSAVWLLVGVIGSLGMNSLLHPFLFRHVAIFRSTRTPARWAAIAYVGFVVLSASGIDLLMRHRTGWKRVAAGCLIVLLAVADVLPRISWEQAVTDPVPVYEWLAKEHPPGPVLELPMAGGIIPFPYLLGSTRHHVPIMNGTSGFEPPLHRTLRLMAETGEFNDVFLTALEENGCRWLVVHADSFVGQREPLVTWLREAISTGHLVLFRRFDHGVEGDYVFALPRSRPGWERFRTPERRDAVGRTPAENLQLFFAGEPTYSAQTALSLETPEQGARVDGSLTVTGWALSPNGISRAEVLVHSGKRRFLAESVPRGEISAKYPWYADVPRPGFRLTLRRPKGIPRETDVRVVVYDRRGQPTHSEDRMITWD